MSKKRDSPFQGDRFASLRPQGASIHQSDSWQTQLTRVTNRFFHILLLSLLLGACGKSPEEARRELAELDIPYTLDSFEKAVHSEDDVVVDLFLKTGKDPSLVLADAVLQGNIELVQKFLENGADPNYRNGLPLYYAAGQGNNKIVKLLLDKGAKPDLKAVVFWGGDRPPRSPLEYASSEGHTETVKLLISRGANPNDGSSGNSVALLYAIWTNNIELVKLLLEGGANANSSGKVFIPIHSGGAAQTAIETSAVEVASGRNVVVGKMPEMLALLEKYEAKSDSAQKAL